MEKVKFTDPETQEVIEFIVEEETQLNGTKYLLVSEDAEDGTLDAYILKEVVDQNDEVLYEVVEDEVIIDYSVDEILEQHKNNQLNLETEEEENDSVSEEDEWKLILVNKQHPIPDDYEFALGTITGNLKCDERIIPELLEMLQAAKDKLQTLVNTVSGKFNGTRVTV